MIRLEELKPAREAEFNELLLGDPRSLIYSSTEYRNFLERSVGGKPRYLLAINDAGAIVGILPIFVLDAPGFGRVINSLPWYGSHGGCVVLTDDQWGVRRCLLQGYLNLIHDQKALSSTIVLSPFEESGRDIYQSMLHPVAIDSRVGQMTQLPENGSDLTARLEAVLAQKTRNLARKARKQGFELIRSSDQWAWDFLHKTHQENMQGIGGRAKPRAHFDALKASIPESWREISIAMLNGRPVAALLLLFFNKTVEYFTPVIVQEYRALQPLSFLIWHGMLNAVGQGFSYWNWGGTWHTQRSLHHFKAGWGAVDVPYSYFVNASDKGLKLLREERRSVVDAFPYYYLYPFDKL